MGKTIIEELENFEEQIIVDNCEHLRKSGCEKFCDGCDCIIIRAIEALFRRLDFYDKLSIINSFHEWCEENIEEKTPAAMLEYLNYRGMLVR